MRYVFVISLLVSAIPVSAQVKPATNQTVTPSANGGDRMICRTLEEIGSRLAKKRVCLTAAQLVEQRRIDAADVQDAQRKSKY